ncbi:carbohydrate sulfotransferase 15-like [Synchiropus splendidus]|uniref:carbohydrate sulfotransferase 15-like n=1 Tax=Synchiropus splendidus TaxID=270530 RepID=UPI00237DA98C|nr:carbohydrate sulfotransferase 15-like [Synchiropus splendidus]
MSRADYKYHRVPDVARLHSVLLAEKTVNAPIRTFLSYDRLKVKWFPLQSDLCGLSKFKFVSVLFALTLTFMVGASYVLSGSRDRLLFIPPPYQIFTSVVPPSSLEERLIDLVNLIESKLEYPPRRAPDPSEVMRNDSQVFSRIPHQFLPGVKSPCWYEKISSEIAADLYKTNNYNQKSVFKSAAQRLRSRFQHLYQGKQHRLRCLPYFYIIGQPKCGTTDLFYRLMMHPEVRFNIMKEPHWWTRRRFGDTRVKGGFDGRFPLQDYLDLFDYAAFKIEEAKTGNSTGDLSSLIVTGEASASTMWDNKAWSCLHGDKGDSGPPFLVQDFIHTVQPAAKIIVMLRDPGERLYSDYLYFNTGNKSAQDFHQRVTESVQLFQSCLLERSLRSCVYNTTLSKMMAVRLHLGMYVVFLLDWLTVFHRDQVLVLRLEDYAVSFKKCMKKVTDFLALGPLSKPEEASLTDQPMYNSRREKDRQLGPMLPTTRTLLREYYKPFNQKLARVLDDAVFLWSDT